MDAFLECPAVTLHCLLLHYCTLKTPLYNTQPYSVFVFGMCSYICCCDALKRGLCLCCSPGTTTFCRQPDRVSGREDNDQTNSLKWERWVLNCCLSAAITMQSQNHELWVQHVRRPLWKRLDEVTLKQLFGLERFLASDDDIRL